MAVWIARRRRSGVSECRCTVCRTCSNTTSVRRRQTESHLLVTQLDTGLQQVSCRQTLAYSHGKTSEAMMACTLLHQIGMQQVAVHLSACSGCMKGSRQASLMFNRSLDAC